MKDNQWTKNHRSNVCMFNAHNSFRRQNAHLMSLGSMTVTTSQKIFLLLSKYQHLFIKMNKYTFFNKHRFSLPCYSVKIFFGNSYRLFIAITSLCKLGKWLRDSVHCGYIFLCVFISFILFKMLKFSVRCPVHRNK